MWGYEKHDLNRLIPESHSFTKAIDDDWEDINHSRRAGGYGGIAVIWKDSMDHLMRPAEKEGNARIQVVTCNLTTPVCLINCYLPSGNSKTAIEIMREDIDALYEITEKYSPTHEIVLIGDLNVDHHNRKNKKEEILLKFIADTDLTDFGTNREMGFSYINPFLNHKSRIDHILGKCQHSSMEVTEVQLLQDDEGVNTSYHRPLSAKLTLKKTEATPALKGPVRMRKYDRQEMDKTLFRETLEHLLANISVDLLPTEVTMVLFQQAIDQAFKCATPYKTITIGGKKKKGWTPDLAEAVKNSKEANWRWKTAGKLKGDNKWWAEKKNAKKRVRSVQRKQRAEERKALLQEISEAYEGNQALAHKLIRKQRADIIKSEAIWIGESLVTEEVTIRNAWANYCEDLSFTDPNNENEKLLQYRRMLVGMENEKVQLSEAEVTEAIGELKMKKAMDPGGLCAEQLRNLPNKGIQLLTATLRRTLEERIVPSQIKEAYKIMIPKPGKDSRVMDNWRGITITTIILKILEIICRKKSLEEAIDSELADLQMGFTYGRSPAMASLMITEAAAEAKLAKTPLIATSLDAKKAFDVVNHSKLKAKLYSTTISPTWWAIIDNLYMDSSECIRWKGIDSRKYQVFQGVKQGSVISPYLYKLYINNLLKNLAGNNLGMSIGSQYVGSPACADDVILLTQDLNQVQPLLTSASEYAALHDYELHPKKTVITSILKPKTSIKIPEENEWYLNGAKVTQEDSFTHLGLTWKSNSLTPDVDANIQKARRACYSLLKIGLHGTNGIDPPAALKIIQTYVIPRLLQGLEATVLNREDLQKLDKFHKKMLRQIQSLPDSTATEAIYILAGTIPIEAQLHIRALGLFGGICRLEGSHTLKNLALRQLALRIDYKHSWFSYIYKLGCTYNINIVKNLLLPKTKREWKLEVKMAVRRYWIGKLNCDTSTKSSLSWLITRNPVNWKAHPVWSPCEGNTRMIEAAGCRARLLAGRFKTQELLAKFNSGTSSVCQLCKKDPEDVLHMIVLCPNLEIARKEGIERIQVTYKEEGLTEPTTIGEICSAVLNGDCYISSIPRETGVISLKEASNIKKINGICNILCKRLAKERDWMLNNILIDSSL